MATKSEGKGEAKDASVATADSGEETAEEHEANIRAKLREQADAAVEAAERFLEKTKDHVEGAEQALKEAKAEQAKLGEK